MVISELRVQRYTFVFEPPNILATFCFNIRFSDFFALTLQSLLRQGVAEGHQIEIWCNGSTTDSGSVSEGSSPSISTTLRGL